eukprot:TRINITY_DN4356_c2_g1_i3.p1 TRINITY_DN4356_c2_g1~~TRINITY_DN4356_c2_g1_i3.p1  ORF type:complete len:359 (+),score=111.57 TRINITY_DN4356_c2_g1_i3:300-1376(+)
MRPPLCEVSASHRDDVLEVNQHWLRGFVRAWERQHPHFVRVTGPHGGVSFYSSQPFWDDIERSLRRPEPGEDTTGMYTISLRNRPDVSSLMCSPSEWLELCQRWMRDNSCTPEEREAVLATWRAIASLPKRKGSTASAAPQPSPSRRPSAVEEPRKPRTASRRSVSTDARRTSGVPPPPATAQQPRPVVLDINLRFPQGRAQRNGAPPPPPRQPSPRAPPHRPQRSVSPSAGLPFRPCGPPLRVAVDADIWQHPCAGAASPPPHSSPLPSGSWQRHASPPPYGSPPAYGSPPPPCGSPPQYGVCRDPPPPSELPLPVAPIVPLQQRGASAVSSAAPSLATTSVPASPDHSVWRRRTSL